MKKQKKRLRTVGYTLVLFWIVLCSTGCDNLNKNNTEKSKEIFAMDTYMTVTAYGSEAEEAVTKAQKKIMELDRLLSTGSSTSEVSLLNRERTAELSEDVYSVLQRSLEVCVKTEGHFNPALYPVMKAWGFADKNYRVPEQKELQALLTCTNIADITDVAGDVETHIVSLNKEGMELDFGGIAKGYTSDCIMDIYRECGIKSGIVSLGGNVQVLGSKPDGSPWKIGVQSPDKDGTYAGILSVTDKAVITSGGYERYFEEAGKTYHHIIDPFTGYPVENELESVTIVSDDGTLADGLSTALFVMGLEKATEFWREYAENFDAIFLTKDNIYVTEGMKDAFSSEKEVTVITH